MVSIINYKTKSRKLPYYLNKKNSKVFIIIKSFKCKMRKKAVSPVISTVLLVMMVIILAIIIMVWSIGFIKEIVLKNDKAIERVCSEVGMNQILNDVDGSFGFQNAGNVPIYAVNLKLIEANTGSSTIVRINGSEGGNLVNPGNTIILQDDSGIDYDSGIYEKITIIPILLGEIKNGGLKEKECGKSYGLTIK